MPIFSRKEFADLSTVHDAFCISVFIPTHRSGQEVIQQQDALVLKNQLKEVRSKLQQQGLNKNEVMEMTEPIHQLVQDQTFWNHQSDGLAIFLSNGTFQKFTLPVHFEEFNYVSNEFYLKPLMPLFTGDGKFFILPLELKSINFFEGTRHTITDVIIEDLVPERIEDVVGYDFEQKSLQFRSQQEGHGEATFHGHGEARDKYKDEIQQFFRAIDKGLMKMLFDEKAPMVVVSLDYLFSMYKEVNTYQYLVDNNVSKNPANMDKLLMHELAWEKVQPIFDRERREKLALIQQFRDTEKASAEISNIVPAAIAGKVDTLLLENRTDIWGTYHVKDNSVRVEKDNTPPNVSLMNLAAINVFLKNGQVYLLDKDEMPFPQSKVNALYRY